MMLMCSDVFHFRKCFKILVTVLAEGQRKVHPPFLTLRDVKIIFLILATTVIIDETSVCRNKLLSVRLLFGEKNPHPNQNAATQ